ncbi:MAG: BsaA family SipW-dependent biofilm matrix protein [Ruminococcus sp.]|uniref:BsaA family SipW-dependent biofilm matrix protein n=1 Tax=Ruminococcus sp. TaxID=41978 RepID=UPI0025F48D74|nr:BsaA family SipW-dependent biofilm matrix protein [Ruminococcus sp.]MCR4794090.1 BsaA family SipW-dependent biofilm matrix protein [Ruminococcus sp.]
MSNDISKKKKTSKEKRVLIASLCIAAAIAAGSTFAWFTSKDEVTNRLSASAAYNVSIAEDFQPPEEWVPGQVIEKNVSATNTGNVDAFVRMWMQGEMRVIKEDANGVALDSIGTITDATDENYKKLGFTKYNGSKYLKTLSKTSNENPDDAQNASSTNTKAYSEVMAMQSGGFLAYAPSDAEYSYTTNQETVLDNYYNGTALISKTVPANTNVEVVASNTADNVTAQTYDGSSTYFKGVAIDSDTFKPKTTGLYLFRRIIDTGTDDKYEYSGYYYIAGSGYGDGTYYALQTGKHATTDTNTSDNTVPTSQITVALDSQSNLVDHITPACKLLTVTESKVENSGLNWVYTPGTDGKATMTATYNGGTADDTTDDIAIDVALVNVDARTTGLNKDDNTKGDTETWKAIGSGALTTFYYNNDLESGDTTSRLIDSVMLNQNTTQKAYYAFDFDLNVFLESVQVTKDETNKELTTPVTPWNASTNGASTPANVNTGAKTSTPTYDTTDATEINVVGWTALS